MLTTVQHIVLRDANTILRSLGYLRLADGILGAIDNESTALNWSKTPGYNEYFSKYKGYALRICEGTLWEATATRLGHDEKITIGSYTSLRGCEARLIDLLDKIT